MSAAHAASRVQAGGRHTARTNPAPLTSTRPPAAAHRLYKLALQRGFTRGRRTNQVAAACLYLVCRQDEKPFLLIDFSDALQVRVRRGGRAGGGGGSGDTCCMRRRACRALAPSGGPTTQCPLLLCHV